MYIIYNKVCHHPNNESNFKKTMNDENAFIPPKIYVPIKKYHKTGQVRISPLHETSKAFINTSPSDEWELRGITEYFHLEKMWNITYESLPEDDPQWKRLLIFITPEVQGFVSLGYFDDGKFHAKGVPEAFLPSQVGYWAEFRKFIPSKFYADIIGYTKKETPNPSTPPNK